jgi:hypothetical protein
MPFHDGVAVTFLLGYYLAKIQGLAIRLAAQSPAQWAGIRRGAVRRPSPAQQRRSLQTRRHAPRRAVDSFPRAAMSYSSLRCCVVEETSTRNTKITLPPDYCCRGTSVPSAAAVRSPGRGAAAPGPRGESGGSVLFSCPMPRREEVVSFAALDMRLAGRNQSFIVNAYLLSD